QDVFRLMRAEYFFFSSRRRHTRSKRDWSSDVCSSDLEVVAGARRVLDVRDVNLRGGVGRHQHPSPVEALARRNLECLELLIVGRSEERRVGKECRYRWALYRSAR